MPLQNRVRPNGEIVSVVARGTMMGNRGGRLHRPDRTLGQRHWASRRWICCRLDFAARRREVMGRGYTELFFLDEVTALAAGHRPCFECRRRDANRFAGLFADVRGPAFGSGADAIDHVLHLERLTEAGAKRTFRLKLGGLPDGAMFRTRHTMATKRAGRLAAWSDDGYASLPRTGLSDDAEVEVLTPPSIVATLAAGYVASFHASIEAVSR
jgi:hypothetical protein